MNSERIIRLEIPGKPSGKARPRVSQHGHFYSPKAGNFEAKVAYFAQQAHIEPVEGPVALVIAVYRAMPKSWSKKRRAALENSLAIGKPDAANVEAAVHDALNGLAYRDDQQVAKTAFVRLWYSSDVTMISILQGVRA